MKRDSKSPVMGSTAGGGMSNRDWWPNQLNLKIQEDLMAAETGGEYFS